MTEPIRRLRPIARVSVTPEEEAGQDETPAAISNFNWEAGIQFTPFEQGPTYTHNGRPYFFGNFTVEYIGVSSSVWGTLDSACMREYVYQIVGPHASARLACLWIELPPASATYILSLDLASLREDLSECFHMYLTDDINERIEVPLARLAGQRGFTGIYTINPMRANASSYVPQRMRHVSCRIDFEFHKEAQVIKHAYIFRGFSIMRL